MRAWSFTYHRGASSWILSVSSQASVRRTAVAGSWTADLIVVTLPGITVENVQTSDHVWNVLRMFPWQGYSEFSPKPNLQVYTDLHNVYPEHWALSHTGKLDIRTQTLILQRWIPWTLCEILSQVPSSEGRKHKFLFDDSSNYGRPT